MIHFVKLLLVILALPIAFGLFFLITGVLRRYSTRRSMSWHTASPDFVTGVVSSSSIEDRKRHSDKPGQANQSGDVSISTSRARRPGQRLVLGTVLYIVGRMLVVCGALASFLLVPLLRLPSDAWKSVFAAGVVVVLIGLRIQLYGKRLRSETGEDALARDQRDPVVYLRPFMADAPSTEYGHADSFSDFLSEFVGTKFSPFGGMFKLLQIVPTVLRMAISPTSTYEEQLKMALNAFGPAIAVGYPGETLPPAGIPRLYFATSLWQENVNALLKRARLVIIQCGVSRESNHDGYWPFKPPPVEGGFRWELNTVVAQVPPEKLVLLLPFDGLEYECFCSTVQDIFPCKFPEYKEGTSTSNVCRSLLWFDTDWSPFLAPITWLDDSFRLDTRYPLVTNLRSKFEAVTGGSFDLRYGGSKLGKRLIAVLIDLLIVGSITFLWIAALNQLKWLTDATFGVALLVMLPIIACAYFALFEASALMATTGKRLLGLMVVDINGHRMSLSQSFLRAATKFFLLPVTWIPALFASDKPTLHDRFSNSMVTLGALRASEPPRRWAAFLSGSIATAATIFLIVLGNVIQLSPLHFPPGVDRAEVAFQPTKGFILMPVSVNDHQLIFLLSTTASETVIDRSSAGVVGIKSGHKTNFSLGGKRILADVSMPYKLYINSLQLTNTRFHIVDLAGFGAYVGVHVDGVIGYDLLSRSVIEINFPGRKLGIIRPRVFHYHGTGESIPLAIGSHMPSVIATIKVPGHEALRDTFWLNPGVQGGVNHPLILNATGTLAVPSGSGTDKPLKLGKVEYVQLGKIRLEGLPSICCTGLDQMDRLVGSIALRRFNVILDYEHSRAILEPSGEQTMATR